MRHLDLADLDLHAPVAFTMRPEGAVRLKVRTEREYTPTRRFYAIAGFCVVALLVAMPVVHGAILFISDIVSFL